MKIMHNLKNILLLNSLHNIISEPTRQLALLDPIIVNEEMSPLSLGIIQVPDEINDHCATYVHIPFEYQLHILLLLEMYGYIKMQIMNCSIKIISDFGRSCLHQGTVNEASSLSLNLLNCAYLVKLL